MPLHTIDTVPKLFPEFHIMWIVKETNNLLANTEIAFKYIDTEMFNKPLISYLRPKLEYASLVWSHRKKRVEKYVEVLS